MLFKFMLIILMLEYILIFKLIMKDAQNNKYELEVYSLSRY